VERAINGEPAERAINGEPAELAINENVLISVCRDIRDRPRTDITTLIKSAPGGADLEYSLFPDDDNNPLRRLLNKLNSPNLAD
jgi:hypothetical protein